MKSDLKISFDTILARSLSGVKKDEPDRIALRDYVVEVEIGAFQQERGVTQRLKFNIVLEVKPHIAGESDDVDQVLSYDSIIEAIDAQLKYERLNLLETLAERISEQLLQDLRVIRVFIRIEKLDRVPGSLGVEIVRTQADSHADDLLDETFIPKIYLMPNSILYSDALDGWLDAIVSRPETAIICVEMPECKRPVSNQAMTDKRIELLAFEQNAWVLAGKDKRCVVVDSRTELDWAIKHHRLSVWAPSKLILDSFDVDDNVSHWAGNLAIWLASEFSADHITILGNYPVENIQAQEIAIFVASRLTDL